MDEGWVALAWWSRRRWWLAIVALLAWARDTIPGSASAVPGSAGRVELRSWYRGPTSDRLTLERR